MQNEFPDDSFDGKLVAVLKLMEEESQVKKDLKQKAEAIHLKTKEIIENFYEDTSLHLLKLKWIKPLVDGICGIPDAIISEFAKKVVALSQKYQTTFADVEVEIEKTNAELSRMIASLTGSSADMEGLAEFRKILGV